MEARLQLLGLPLLLVDGVRADAALAHNARRLFYYLALHRDRVHARETVAGVLWGDRVRESALRTLRSELYRLRKGITAVNPAIGKILAVTPTTVQFRATDHCSTDVDEFERFASMAVGQPARSLSSDEIQSLRAAVSLYHGPLLMDTYEDWCVFERQRLHELYIEVLSRLMVAEGQNLRYHEAIEFGNQILAEEPLMEKVHRQLMRLHYRDGNRAAALRQFEICRRLLNEELGVEPMRRTRNIYSRILRDTLESATPAQNQESPVSVEDIESVQEAGAGDIAQKAAAQLSAAAELLFDTVRSLDELSDYLHRS